MNWEHWRDEKCVKGHSADLSFRMSSTFDWRINAVWNGNIPFHWCPQRARLPPWVSEGLGTPSHELFWRQWLQQVAGEAIVEIWMCFPLGSPPGKDRKILVLSQLPYFFFTLLGTKALQSMWGTLLSECDCLWFVRAMWALCTHVHLWGGRLQKQESTCSRPSWFPFLIS